jgi:hypothetical protein
MDQADMDQAGTQDTPESQGARGRGFDRPLGCGALARALRPGTLLVLLPTSWNDNEEMYFLMAHQRVDPGAFSPYAAVFDDSVFRLVSDWLLGLPILAFGYEAAQVIARLAMGAAYALGLGAFFSALRLSWLDAVAVLAVFILAGEQLFAGEWLFRGVEAKTFAYAAVLGAFGLALRDRWGWAAALVALAVYLHVLVGGFWALALVLLCGLRGGGLGRPVRILGAILLAVAPLAAMIALDWSGESVVAPLGTPTADVIYAALRHPHHIAPFAKPYAIWKWSGGLVATAALLVAFWVAATRAREPGLHKLVVLVCLYLLAALVIAYLDRHDHFFGKFYLFRPNSLMLLLALALAAAGLREAPVGRLPVRILAAAVLATVFLWGQVQYKARAWQFGNQAMARYAPVIDAVERESAPGEIVLLQPPAKGLPTQPRLALHRLIPRLTLVSPKFIPTNPRAILRWYALTQFQRRLFTEGCAAPLEHPVKLLVVFNLAKLPKVTNCGPVVWQGKRTAVVRVGG